MQSKFRLFVVSVVLTSSALMIGPASAQEAPTSPEVGACQPGAGYASACDVDHDGDVDIFDIQLTAGRWGQTGVWMSDNDHNHLGQTWAGSNNALKLTGAYGNPDYAPLVLSNSSGMGLRIASASDSGVYVEAANNRGVTVATAPTGIFVGSASIRGVEVYSTGFDGVSVNTAGRFGVNIFQAGDSGVYVSVAGTNGFEVNTANNDGVSVTVAGSPSNYAPSTAKNGFEVAGAEGNGVYVGYAGSDGVHIRSVGDDGIQIGEGNTYPPYGLYVPDPGTAQTTLLPNTANVAGQWALYTPDNISAGNVLLGSQSLLAVVGGGDALTPGDVVAAAGLADPLPGSQPHLPRVRLATAEQANVVGVVVGRMALQPAAGKDGVEILLSVAGLAQPGDYVAITVLGAAQVKVDPAAAIAAGQRLTVDATRGQVRALRTFKVQLAGSAGVADMLETAPVIGVALELPRDGLVWVLVNPQ